MPSDTWFTKWHLDEKKFLEKVIFIFTVTQFLALSQLYLWHMNSPDNGREVMVLTTTPADINAPVHAQNTVEREGFIKHRQHVTLIYNHMEAVPASYARKGEQYQGSLGSLVTFIRVPSEYRSDPPTGPAAHPTLPRVVIRQRGWYPRRDL